MPGELGAPITVTGTDSAEQISPPTPLLTTATQVHSEAVGKPVSVA